MARMKKKMCRLADSTAHISPLKTIGARKNGCKLQKIRIKRGMAANGDNTNGKNDSSKNGIAAILAHTYIA